MNDWQTKILLAVIPIILASAGWLTSLESRIQVIDARQQERTGRFDHLEAMVSQLSKLVTDPAPKPETKIAIESLRRDVDNTHDDLTRINERINNLHNFLIQSPPFKPQGKRGNLFDTPLIYPQRGEAVQ